MIGDPVAEFEFAAEETETETAEAAADQDKHHQQYDGHYHTSWESVILFVLLNSAHFG